MNRTLSIILFTVMPFFVCAENKTQPNQGYVLNLASEQQATNITQLRFELSNEIKDIQTTLQPKIEELFSEASINLESSADTSLVVRIRSLDVNDYTTAFLQVAFFEKATLVRNRGGIEAMTWSKAALLAIPKEEVTQEIEKNILDMVTLFVQDYQKVLNTK